MTRPGLVRWGVTLALTLVVASVLAVAVTRGSAAPSPNTVVGAGAGANPAVTPHELTSEEAGRAFLDGYVDPDGRVVRHDQGGDTVSEGQAYAMLIAVGLRDRSAFERVWSWTSTNLLRADGTLSWRWKDGRVVDESSASDADLDAARALVLAGQVFADPQLSTAGETLGTAVLDVETVSTELGRILVAGNWATTEPYAYNPSYASPAAVAVVARGSSDKRWAALERGTRALTTRMLTDVDLPPDWAQVHDNGRVDPMPGAAGRGNEGVRYGYDATRLPLRYAESCRSEDVALAAGLAAPLARFSGDPAARDLGGRPLTQDESVVAIAAQAAVHAAAGDRSAAAAALVRADHLQQQVPTYYGGAWDALARMLLTDPIFGGCPPLSQ